MAKQKAYTRHAMQNKNKIWKKDDTAET